jgi:antitoxin ParD1/3/4
MHVRFPHSDESFIKAEVKKGFYTNETEVVRDAIRRLREEKERMSFHAAIMAGDAAIERGKTTPYSKTLMQKIVRQGVKAAKQKKPYDSPEAVP